MRISCDEGCLERQSSMLDSATLLLQREGRTRRNGQQPAAPV